MSEYETVEFEVADHIATITLNRPNAMNAFNQPMLDDFQAIWRRIRRDDDIYVVVLRANGERAFSTGVDRKEGRERFQNPWLNEDPGIHLGAKQNRVWKPLIIACHGMVAGGAFYWLNEADVIICSEDATFFDPHTTYGLTSALEPIGMARRIPIGESLRMALFGLDERMTSGRAHQIGLVSEVVSREDLWPRAQLLAERLASKPPIAIQGTVRAFWDSMHMSIAGIREIPLLYTQLGNPISSKEFVPGRNPPFELRG